MSMISRGIRHPYSVALALAVTAMLARAHTLGAQQRQTPDTGRPGWTIVPSLTFSGSWDDNVLLRQQLAETPNDYLTGLNPAAAVDYVGRYNRFRGAYAATFQVYRALDDLNTLEQHANTQFARRLTPRVTWFVGDSFARAPTTALDLPQLRGAPFVRTGSRVNDFITGTDAAVGRHGTLRASYGFSWVAFEQDAFASALLKGGHSHDLSVALDEQVTRRLTIGGSYQYHQVSIGGGAERFGLHAAGATIQAQVSPTVTVTAGLGIDRLGASVAHPSRTGTSWRAGIVRRTPDLLAEAAYVRSLLPSFTFGGTMENQEISGVLRTPIRPGRVYGEVRGGWSSNDALTADRPSLRTLGLSLLGGFAVNRYVRLEGFYDRAQQNSQLAGGRIERNRFGFQIVTSRPMRAR